MTKETLQKITHLLGLSYQELAAESGYSFATIDSYMKGTRKPSEKIQRFLQKKVHDAYVSKDEAIVFLIESTKML